MIRIREASPTKLSGLTSLYVSFDFNPEIVPIIKSCEKYIYDKKTYTWELPLTSLAYLLDNLTYIDDITLTLAKDDSETRIKINMSINDESIRDQSIWINDFLLKIKDC